MEKNWGNQKESQGYHECEIKKLRADENQGTKTQRKRARRAHASWEKHEYENEH